ncbi:hypothetical protein C8J56DRAFT_414823 [Mycena floridula]|nr:hypothetical protein C8J56DRAFT_414823 [Mycena floridula]
MDKPAMADIQSLLEGLSKQCESANVAPFQLGLAFQNLTVKGQGRTTVYQRTAQAQYYFRVRRCRGSCGLFIGLSFFCRKDSQKNNQNKLFTVYLSPLSLNETLNDDSMPLANQIFSRFIEMRTVYEIRERPPSRIWTALVAS